VIEKIQTLWPEIALFVTTCVVMIVGLSHNRSVRALCAPLCGVGLFAAGLLAAFVPGPAVGLLPGMAVYGKVITAAVGILLLLLMPGVADRDLEAAVARGGRFEPLRSNRAEFYSFFLFSLTGLMLCAGADDLIWLFLALELTSLPTYVMVAISTPRNRSVEASVKYFFLGAMGAAIFLYGFALIYGATGTTHLVEIRDALAAQVASGAGFNMLAMVGLVMAVVGVSFKIAAVPMHFYTPDVYQGAAAPISAFLAFVPKSAGFFALILLLATVGWSHGPAGDGLPGFLYAPLWVIAVLTMTAGNVLAILQNSVKRILAYSSIAHSGYMLVGLIAGPGRSGAFADSGIAAVLFYLLAYGVMNMGAFAVVASLERRNRAGELEEADSVADLRGLCATHPVLGWTMVLSSVGLLGLPLTFGFVAKLPLFTAGIAAGEIPLVIILGLNSAIAAYYYLRLAAAPLLEKPEEPITGGPVVRAPFPSRVVAGVLSAAGVLILGFTAAPLGDAANRAVGGHAPASGDAAAGVVDPGAQLGRADVAGPELGKK